jgi:hypothetical protein
VKAPSYLCYTCAYRYSRLSKASGRRSVHVCVCMRQRARYRQVRGRHSGTGGGCGGQPCHRPPAAANDDNGDRVFQRP